MSRTAISAIISFFFFINQGIAQQAIFLGIDSLTDGAGGSTYRDFFCQGDLTSNLGYIPINYESTKYVGISVYMTKGMSWIPSDSGYDKYPRKFSLDGKGAYAIDGKNEKAVFNLSEFDDFETIGLFYLKQPGGGGFSISLRNGNEASIKVQINSKSDNFDIGYVEIKNNFCKRFTIDDIKGKVVFFGLYFKDSSSNKTPVNSFARGGMRLRQVVKLDRGFRQKWFSRLNPGYYILNAGMNDRKRISPDRFKKDLTIFLEDIKKGAPDCNVIIIEPNEPNDYKTTFLPEYRLIRKEVSKQYKNVFYYSIPEEIGNYQYFKENQMMLDFVHPNDKGNQTIGKELYAFYLDIK